MTICLSLSFIMLHLAPLFMVNCKSISNATDSTNGPENTGSLEFRLLLQQVLHSSSSLLPAFIYILAL